jgi:pseudouridine-5'-phosphate glycosidase
MPVVALESTIIAHGFPRPRNLEVAGEMEDAVSACGAVPATIGVIDGRAVVGLDAAELDRMATGDVAKLNVSNLAVALAAGITGATTVSATLRIAGAVGIRVMATGGIGGVHRLPPTDVSSDLPELGRFSGVVVSSGAKSFLDLPATLDYLETVGVTVVGYGVSEFPAFYSVSSGLGLTSTVHSPAEAAAVVRAAVDIGGGSVLVANPVPAAAALDPQDVARWTTAALTEAADASGLDSSPAVLAAMAAASGGRTVTANAALAVANATLAAQIAVAL